jgi:sigma54-dependent transcription regulator
MPTKRCVVFGSAGTSLEKSSFSESGAKFKWEPNLELCQARTVDRYVLLWAGKRLEVAQKIEARIKSECPWTQVELRRIDLGNDAWDFQTVYLGLDTLAAEYQFKNDEEDYFVHMVRGTFVMQICFFCLVESRRIPAKLLHNVPAGRQPARGEWREGGERDADEALLRAVLSEEQLSKINRFDQFQLAGVVRVCRDSASCAAAGRQLFAATREPDANDSARLGQYLKKFGLNFQDCKKLASS